MPTKRLLKKHFLLNHQSVYLLQLDLIISFRSFRFLRYAISQRIPNVIMAQAANNAIIGITSTNGETISKRKQGFGYLLIPYCFFYTLDFFLRIALFDGFAFIV